MKNRTTWYQNPAGFNPYVYNQPGATYNTIYPIYNGVLAANASTRKATTYVQPSKNRATFTRPTKNKSTWV